MNNKTNIFGISNPNKSECRILRYHAGHSKLLLKIGQEEHNENPVYVIFTLVKYFEGPLLWTGGDFWIGKPDETVEILSKIKLAGIEDQKIQHVYLEEYKLFVGKISNSGMVKILASTYSVESAVPRIDFPDL